MKLKSKYRVDQSTNSAGGKWSEKSGGKNSKRKPCRKAERRDGFPNMGRKAKKRC